MVQLNNGSMTSAALGVGALAFAMTPGGAAKSLGVTSASVGMRAAGAFAAS